MIHSTVLHIFLHGHHTYECFVFYYKCCVYASSMIIMTSVLKLWQGLGTPAEERVQILAALLDSAQPTAELTRRCLQYTRLAFFHPLFFCSTVEENRTHIHIY